MKKGFCVMIALVVILTATGIAFAAENVGKQLSAFSDEECVAFLKEYGVDIPYIYENEMECVPFVRTVIEQIESNPNEIIRCKNYILLQFALDIKTAVNAYYGDAKARTYITSDSSSILEDNVKYGTWRESYLDYNCYGHAIGKDVWIKPGFSTWVSGGNDLKTYYCNGYANMPTMAGWVKTDLEYYGYTVTEFSATMPNTQVSDHTHLICIRKDLQETTYINELGNLETNHDFHLMRLDEDGNWYHKPSYTNPLRYKYIPTNGSAWVLEGYDGVKDEYFRDEDFAYESEIYFIEYTTPHKWEYVYCGTNNGTHQHIRTCTVCWETTGTAMACNYLTGSNNCRICGHNKNLIVTSLGLPQDIDTYLNE